MTTNFDIHVHTHLDPVEGRKAFNFITHSPEKLFKKAQKKGFSVLALTHHKELVYSKALAKKAKEYGILLIPGVEAIVEGVDVIVLNPLKKTYDTFTEIKEERKKTNIVLYLPHTHSIQKSIV